VADGEAVVVSLRKRRWTDGTVTVACLVDDDNDDD
jgi:hypothetical protein